MKPMMEFSAFLGLALGAHVMLWQGTGDAAGAMGATQQVGATVQLAGANQPLQAMVADWDRPPSIDTATPTLAIAAPDLSPPQPAPLEYAARAPMAAPALPLALPEQAMTSDSPPPPPKPKSKPTEPAPQKAKAATTPPKAKGGGQAAGRSGGKTAAPSATAKAGKAGKTKADPGQMARWGGGIRSSIERRKKFPSGSRAKGAVSLAITVSTNGALAGLSIAKSSGDAALDRAALDAVKRARLPKAPAGIPAGSHRFTLSVSFGR